MSISLVNFIDTFLDDRGLDFIIDIGSKALYPGVIYPIGNSSSQRDCPRSPLDSVYDINPTRTYTAMGDLRCILEASDPNFFEDLERHLLVDNADDEMLKMSGT